VRLNPRRRARVCLGVARPTRAVLVATAAALALSAAPARADSILYRCFPNLCRVAPDGSGQTQLTRDGERGGPVYAWLSATRDGSRLGVSFGNRAHVLDTTGSHVAGPLPSSGGPILVTHISPDGRQIATIETITETLAPYPGGPPTVRLTPYLFLARADGSDRDTVARSTVTTNWLAGRLLRDEAADEEPFEQRICLLASNTDFPCERLVAADPGHELWDPAVSPDGNLVAATRAPVDRASGEIAIYSAATGQLVRVVSSGPSDNAPTWSPDGRRIAFARGDGGLWVVSASGAPGSERRILASGIQPVWVRGGGALRLTGPKRARAGRRVRIRLAGAPPGARARLQRRAGGRWRALATRRAGARATTFSLRLARGRALLRAQVRAPGGATTVSRTLRVRVRPGES
jgi:dipeptidyl aminopeptidase/acylaminoacyl peptidase